MQKNSMFLMIILCSMFGAQSFLAQESTKEATLFKAVKSNNFSLVKKLIKQGVSLNELNNNQKTVLDIATERQYKKIARYLLKNGAKVTTESNMLLLRKYLQGRALGFFVAGCFFTPFLWIGSGLALISVPLIQIL